MSDVIELTKAIKRAAVEAVRAEKPAAVCFGKVTSVSPLKIMVEQKMALGMPQLVLTRNVTDHNVNISGSDAQVTVYKGLAVSDEVVLLRQQGGQKYIVVDRVG